MAAGAHLVLALDQGTTSTRCMLFDRSFSVVAMHQLGHDQLYPQPGWVEHDPLQIWQRAQECMAGALRSARAGPRDVAAIGITNQRETTVLWERATGRPVAPAVVWQDTRTADLCAELAAEGGGDRFRSVTGLPISTYSSAPKITWLLDQDPSRRAAAERGELLFGTIDTWLLWNLTGGPGGGVHMTDPSNASRTLLMDLRRLDWDDALLAAMRVPRAMLPRIQGSSEVYGLAVGDLAGVPVAGDLGDQQAALFGHTCFSRGEVKNTYGTGCFLLMNTETEPVESRHGLITTVFAKLGDAPATYALEGSVAIAGALVQWLRDNLGLIREAEEVEGLAASVEDSGGVVFVPAFSGLFAPYWRTDARGVIAGLTRYVNRGHIARAALEATAYQTVELAEAMVKDTGSGFPPELRVDGGMTRNRLLMQMQADLLGVPVVTPPVAEVTALGAAMAAGLAVGFWSGLEELRAGYRTTGRWEPRSNDQERRRGLELWRRGVARSLGWAEAGP
jgi:glycerol kinase